MSICFLIFSIVLINTELFISLNTLQSFLIFILSSVFISIYAHIPVHEMWRFFACCLYHSFSRTCYWLLHVDVWHSTFHFWCLSLPLLLYQHHQRFQFYFCFFLVNPVMLILAKNNRKYTGSAMYVFRINLLYSSNVSHCQIPVEFFLVWQWRFIESIHVLILKNKFP